MASPTTVTQRVDISALVEGTTKRISGDITGSNTSRLGSSVSFFCFLSLSGDMTDGNDRLELSGDMNDAINPNELFLLSGEFASPGPGNTTKRVAHP